MSRWFEWNPSVSHISPDQPTTDLKEFHGLKDRNVNNVFSLIFVARFSSYCTSSRTQDGPHAIERINLVGRGTFKALLRLQSTLRFLACPIRRSLEPYRPPFRFETDS